jgi:hypothetical protein
VIALPVALVSAFACAVIVDAGPADDDWLAARAAAAIASGAAGASEAAAAAGASASGTEIGIAAASGTTITGATDVPCWDVEPAGSVAGAEGASVDEVLSAVLVVDFASLVFWTDDFAPDCDGASLFPIALLAGCDPLDGSALKLRSSVLSLGALVSRSGRLAFGADALPTGGGGAD